ncbi:MAG: aminotransferase class III-fold pyridoxal phosphate-dependent enzyme [Bryobacteraceae bacterium]
MQNAGGPPPLKSWGSSGPDACQRNYLEQFASRYCGRSAGSKQCAERSHRVLADPLPPWTFDPVLKEMCYPIIVAQASGAHFVDVDSNEYVDFCLDFGSSLFGHNPSFVCEAIQEVLRAGFALGVQSALAGEVAALVCRLTNMERVAFSGSGTEAVMVALRLARTATARAGVAMFQGSYHGQFDGVLAVPSPYGGPSAFPAGPGIPPSAVQMNLVLPYCSKEALEIIGARADGLAAVLVEPVQTRRLDISPQAFLRDLRRLADAAGIALIFDELTTGFRLALGGAQSAFGVKADLATYGKAAGGGLPIGIIAGSSRFMDAIDGGCWSFGDGSGPRRLTTAVASTFARHPFSLAAAKATLLRLAECGSEMLSGLAQKTVALVGGMNRSLAAEGARLRFVSAGSCFGPAAPFEDPSLLSNRLIHFHLAEQGVFLWGLTGFLSTAHSVEDLERLTSALTGSVRALHAAGFDFQSF